jgi:hypothetical protein
MNKIDTSKLKNVVAKPDGSIVAQCPACAAAGGDATGNHLKVYADGKFGCVTNPKDKDHNKEILKLVGGGDGKARERPKVKIRPHWVPPATGQGGVIRRTLDELGLKRGVLMPIRTIE